MDTVDTVRHTEALDAVNAQSDHYEWTDQNRHYRLRVPPDARGALLAGPVECPIAYVPLWAVVTALAVLDETQPTKALIDLPAPSGFGQPGEWSTQLDARKESARLCWLAATRPRISKHASQSVEIPRVALEWIRNRCNFVLSSLPAHVLPVHVDNATSSIAARFASSITGVRTDGDDVGRAVAVAIVRPIGADDATHSPARSSAAAAPYRARQREFLVRAASDDGSHQYRLRALVLGDVADVLEGRELASGPVEVR